GIAICAPIAPYASVRDEVRRMVEPEGGFILVYVATPLEVCEERDRKGLYAKARAGLVKEFTGISDPYEEPVDADVVIDTTRLSPEESAQEIILHLEREGYVGSPTGAGGGHVAGLTLASCWPHAGGTPESAWASVSLSANDAR
ncbi:MAG TPA: adenylyl-sulfate kinase, partial [Acidimicrobiales bacterium]|nr:adenylyl-sulfate kinase [Acidimicrobiales bacterium]